MSDSLQPYWPQPARAFRFPWDSPGKNAGMGCHALLQGSSLPRLRTHFSMSPALAGGFFTTSTIWEAWYFYIHGLNKRYISFTVSFDFVTCSDKKLEIYIYFHWAVLVYSLFTTSAPSADSVDSPLMILLNAMNTWGAGDHRRYKQCSQNGTAFRIICWVLKNPTSWCYTERN